ncbi:MAG: flagellar protein FliS [Candidatus Paracaedibacteraceae bacterium]|nr:flagellar protein FliS [Candidatus Paracaedibacteraceae bacterium]
MYNVQLRQYQRSQAAIATPLGQIAILLDHCAGLMRRVKVAVEAKDYEGRYNATDKAIVIISSIQSSLAVDRTPEAAELSRFFQEMILFILEVNMKEDLQLCQDVEVALTEMADVWRVADMSVSKAETIQSERVAAQL